MTSLQRDLWIGTYPSAGQGTATGRGEGIWRVSLDLNTGGLGEACQAATTPAPSFLCHGLAPQVVYSVNETERGRVSAWGWADGVLTALGSASTGGSHPCHVSYVETIDALVVTNYTSGSVAVIPVGRNGAIEETEPSQVVALNGGGLGHPRQNSSHAHQSIVSPDERWVLVVDLGADRLWRFAVEKAQRRLTFDGAAGSLPAGVGPRHAVFSATGLALYVAGELDGRVHSFRWDPVRAVADHTGALMVDPFGPATAHIERTDDRLLVGCRGGNTIADVEIDDAGRLSIHATHPLPGICPRHHVSLGGWVIVALQDSGKLVVLDPHGNPKGEAAVPSLSCILPS